MQKLLHKIELLEMLVKGCRVHPAYRAIRPATGNAYHALICGKQDRS